MDFLNFILDDSAVRDALQPTILEEVSVPTSSVDNTESIVFLAVIWFILGVVTALVVGTIIILVVSSRSSHTDMDIDEELLIESPEFNEKEELYEEDDLI